MILRPVFRVFADLLGNLFRLVPHRKRFAAARRLALISAPLVRRSPWYRFRPSALDGHREETMRMLLRAMTRTRVLFDVEIDVHGTECVPSGPALLVSGHFLLNELHSRFLAERNERAAGVVTGPREPIFDSGTDIPRDLLYVGPQLLVQIRNRLAKGQKVFVDIEEANPHDGWTPVETAGGPRYVSPAIPRLAQRLGVPLVFMATRFDAEGRLVMNWARPSSADADIVVAEFCEFLIAEAAQIAR